MEQIKQASAAGGRMGTEPEGRLLFSLSVPIVLSMTVQALYNVVDSIFVSRLSESALTAVSLAYPMQMLMVSLAVGTGVGMNSLISRRLGARRTEEACLAAGNGLFLMLCSAALFALFGLFGVRPFFSAYTSDPEIYEMGVTYLSTCCTFGVGAFFAIGTERIMQAQGKAVWSMIIQMLGAITNIVFDPLLIFGLLGFPKMGILGAAVATVMGQVVSMVLGLIVIFGKNNDVRVQLRGFSPHWGVIRDVYRVGVPSIILQSFSTVMNLVMNSILIAFSATAVAVFGVYFKLQSMIFMPAFGVTNASMSIMAYNFGARNKKRLLRTRRLTIYTTMTIMTIGTMLFLFIPDRLLGLFDASADMLALGVRALRVLGLVFPVAAFCISSSVMYQAVGNGLYSMLLSFVRQMIALVPAALLLSKLFGTVDAVWWAFPVAECVGLLLTLIFNRRMYRGKLSDLPEGAN